MNISAAVGAVVENRARILRAIARECATKYGEAATWDMASELATKIYAFVAEQKPDLAIALLALEIVTITKLALAVSEVGQEKPA